MVAYVNPGRNYYRRSFAKKHTTLAGAVDEMAQRKALQGHLMQPPDSSLMTDAFSHLLEFCTSLST